MIVLDTSFLVAWHNVRDVHHRAAREVAERLREGVWGQALLLEYVFVELTTVLAARRSLAAAVVVSDTLLRAKEIEFVPCSDVFHEAFSVFRTQGAAGLSFVDAAIVATLRQLGERHVATFDTGFDAYDELEVVRS